MNAPVFFAAANNEAELLYVWRQATPEAKVIILCLVIFSIFAWTVMIANGGPLIAALLPCAPSDRVYRGGPDTVIAGVTQPVGTAEATEGGWRVSGRWPFASGCLHADWMGGICIMTEAGKLCRRRQLEDRLIPRALELAVGAGELHVAAVELRVRAPHP